jgi:hypothetical protein
VATKTFRYVASKSASAEGLPGLALCGRGRLPIADAPGVGQSSPTPFTAAERLGAESPHVVPQLFRGGAGTGRRQPPAAGPLVPIRPSPVQVHHRPPRASRSCSASHHLFLQLHAKTEGSLAWEGSAAVQSYNACLF